MVNKNNGGIDFYPPRAKQFYNLSPFRAHARHRLSSATMATNDHGDVSVRLMAACLKRAPKFLPCQRCLIEAASADVSPRGFLKRHDCNFLRHKFMGSSSGEVFFQRETFLHLIITELLICHRPASHETLRCRLGSLAVVLLSGLF